ncbi:MULTISPECIES: hypothetical protein [Protofrankia]|uniref:hypothetical protein n=1 Tax=Protofrankia TaxID=2994361 RepID=UPI00069AC195|nr:MULTISPECIES: hypothetical protein [Protofrankia]ONH34954.1 hypothetical protein BL254_13410 [Protofrankia sp. BMG5.30]
MAAKKARVCPRCGGSGKNGADLCRACNPSAALGDRIVGRAQRLTDRLTGTTTHATSHGTVATRRGRQTVTRPPAGALPPDQRGSAVPACDHCGNSGVPLKLTRRGMTCLRGCPS